MTRDRRMHVRMGVNWPGQVSLGEGPALPARVLDVSAGGARVRMTAAARPQKMELITVTALRRSIRALGARRPLTLTGRVVRIAKASDGQHLQVGIRFKTPLRLSNWLRSAASLLLSSGPERVIACA